MSPDDFDPKQFAPLSDFREDDCEALLELLEPRKLASGRKVFREGSESDGIVFLSSGRIELSGKRSAESAEYGAGAVLGALSMMSAGTREATASTLETCEIWRLPRESWVRLLEDHPRTACRLAEAILAETAVMLREALDVIGGSD